MESLLQRLRRRKLVEWAIAYVLVAVGLYELLGNVADTFAWPPVVLRVVSVLLAVGFLTTIVIAWYHGEKGHQRVTLAEFLILGVLTLIAAALVRIVWPGAAVPASDAAPGRTAGGLADFSSFAASIAVLPPENITGDPADDRFGASITEEIVSTLSRITGLKVIDRNSAASAVAQGGSLSDIANRLGVAHVLTSTLRRAGDQVRIVVHLVDPATTTYLWNQTFEPGPRDPFAVQDSIALSVADKLALTVDAPAADHAHQADTRAYDAYLSGQSWLHQRTRAGLTRAMESFANAIAYDAAYAKAYAALSSAYVLWVTYDYDGAIDHYASYGAALALADRAVAADPDLSDGYLARGFVLSKSWAPAAQAESDFVAALRLQPGNADVHGWYAHLLAREARHPESLAAARRAIDLDPLAPGRDVGYAFDALAAREYDAALRHAQRAAVLAPGVALPRVIEGFALVLLDRAVECGGSGELPAAVLAVCLHAQGDAQRARAIADSLEAAAGGGAPPAYLEAYYALAGDVDATVRSLARSYTRTPNGPDFRIVESGIFDRVRGDPRFGGELDRLRREVWSRVRREADRFRGQALPPLPAATQVTALLSRLAAQTRLSGP